MPELYQYEEIKKPDFIVDFEAQLALTQSTSEVEAAASRALARFVEAYPVEGAVDTIDADICLNTIELQALRHGMNADRVMELLDQQLQVIR